MNQQLSTTARITRDVLDKNAEGAYDGTLTTGDVVRLVKQQQPTASDRAIYLAIGRFGPTCKCDNEWLALPTPRADRFELTWRVKP